MPSKKLEEYMAASKTAKEAEAVMSKHKAHVQKLLRRCKQLGIKVPKVTLIKNERFEFVEDEVYNWLKENMDEPTFKSLVKEIIDLEKLNEAYLNGIIDPTSMPSECYTRNQYYSIRVGK